MNKRYGVALSYEVVEEDGTRMWDGEIAYHGITAKALVDVERLLMDVVGKMKEICANGGTERPVPDRESAGGGSAGEE